VLLELVNAGTQVRLVVEVYALLSVPAVAPYVHDHLARDLAGNEWPGVTLDERKRHVDAGRDAGARDDAVVDHEQPVTHHLRARETRLEIGHAFPVGGARPPVEQARVA
jgi:hypothetical protein